MTEDIRKSIEIRKDAIRRLEKTINEQSARIDVLEHAKERYELRKREHEYEVDKLEKELEEAQKPKSKGGKDDKK